MDGVMRIGFAGLATSHPYTDARTLRDLTGCEVSVWEPDGERLAAFRAEQPDAGIAPDLPGLLAARPDGVVVTVRAPLVADTVARVLAAGVPCFVNKPAAATATQLARLDSAAATAPRLLLTTSVLRYAPAARDLAPTVDRADVLAVRATVRHDVGRWLAGSTPWQDDPVAGGGALVTMGLHGVELLVSLLGPDVRLAGVETAVRHYSGLRSEDTAVMTLRWSDGVLGTVEVLGVAAAESYRLTVHGPGGERTVAMPDGDEGATAALGYRATMERFAGMVAGAPTPVPWAESRAVLGIVTEAAARLCRDTADPP